MSNKKGYRNINGEGSRKVMPDGRIAFKKMVGYKANGKPNIIEVIQRKNETLTELKKRFDEKINAAEAATDIQIGICFITHTVMFCRGYRI